MSRSWLWRWIYRVWLLCGNFNVRPLSGDSDEEFLKKCWSESQKNVEGNLLCRKRTERRSFSSIRAVELCTSRKIENHEAGSKSTDFPRRRALPPSRLNETQQLLPLHAWKWAYVQLCQKNHKAHCRVSFLTYKWPQDTCSMIDSFSQRPTAKPMGHQCCYTPCKIASSKMPGGISRP